MTSWFFYHILISTCQLILGNLITKIPGMPENITITFLSSSTIKVSWTIDLESIEKYDVTYKPTDANYRVVSIVAGNTNSVTLTNLKANTQYQLSITATWNGRKHKSRPIVFRTLESSVADSDTSYTQHEYHSNKHRKNSYKSVIKEPKIPPFPSKTPPNPNAIAQVKTIEITIVVLVLCVWIGAISLFFHRWGKIRMLLPYQPQFKEQAKDVKVPGTEVLAAVTSRNVCSIHSSQTFCDKETIKLNQHLNLAANISHNRFQINFECHHRRQRQRQQQRRHRHRHLLPKAYSFDNILSLLPASLSTSSSNHQLSHSKFNSI